mgnify:FL=1
MSRVFYIADLHLGHENMAIKRGFKNSEEHDNHIIERWNTVIHNRDTVWILGDLTMESPSHYYMLDKLKGIKNAVLGNHDLPQYIPELQKHVNKIWHKVMFLTHCPIHPMELEHRVPKNLHGHCHENFVTIENKETGEVFKDDRYICVSCEQVDYTPRLLNELI